MPENRWLSDLHWRRESRQSRGEKTQAALLDAAESLIVERGVEGTSIADVAKRAGSSVGSVYHHFKDKQALFYALYHRMTAVYEDLSQQAGDPALWQDATVRDLLAGYMDFTLHLRERAGTSKAAVALVMAEEPELKAHMADLKRRGREALLTLILARRAEISHPDPDFAASFVVDQLGAMLFARMDRFQGRAAITILDEEGFKAEALSFCAKYLGLDD